MHEQHQPHTNGKSGSTVSPADPLKRIMREHALQLGLCDALELIADGLPDSVDRRLVREVTGILEHGLRQHFKAEEEVLFPLLRRRGTADQALLAALDQLEKEHTRDEDVCAELLEELHDLAARGRARNADMLGYMLRGFFEGQRRHIAWENSVVIPAARRLLGEADLDELAAKQGPATAARPPAGTPPDTER